MELAVPELKVMGKAVSEEDDEVLPMRMPSFKQRMVNSMQAHVEDPEGLKHQADDVNVFWRQIWNFCGDTSLHGWQYIPRFPGTANYGWAHRIIWALVLFPIFVAPWYVGYGTWREYKDQKPIISVEDTTAPLDMVYFPSITICNLNQVKLSLALKAGISLDQPKKFRDFVDYVDGDSTQEDIDGMSDEMLRRLGWDNKTEPMAENGTSDICADMMLHLSSKKMDVYAIAPEKSYTDAGVCCRIYPSAFAGRNKEGAAAEIDKDSTGPHTEYNSVQGLAGSGPDNGVELLLDMETFENAFYPTRSEGLVVALSENLERPLIAQSGSLVAPGTSTRISLQVKQTTTTDTAIQKYHPDVRKCYKSAEFQPLHFNNKTGGFRYTMTNCLYSSMVEAIETICECTPLFKRYPYENSTEHDKKSRGRCIAEKHTCEKKLTLLWGEKTTIVNNKTLVAGNETVMLNAALNTLGPNDRETCNDNCEFQRIVPTSSSSAYPKSQILPLTIDFCLIVKKVNEICNVQDKHRKRAFERKYVCTDFQTNDCVNGTYTGNSDSTVAKAVLKYAEENLAVVRVYISDPFYKMMVRDKRMSGLTFIGTLGGFFGLCCGLSFVSILEVFYHTLLLVIALCRGKIVHLGN